MAYITTINETEATGKLAELYSKVRAPDRGRSAGRR